MKKIIITICVIASFVSIVFFVFSYMDDEKVIVTQREMNKKEGKSVDVFVDSEDEQSVEVSDNVTILFGGDAMFDRYIRQVSERFGYDHVLNGVGDLMRSTDCVMLNAEGPITKNTSISQYSEIGSPANYVFTFDPIVMSVMKDYNVCVVNIGNNHINNFGREGVDETKKNLEDHQLSYIGDTNTEDEKRYIIKNINGINFAFVNYNAFVGNAIENTLSDVRAVKNISDFVVLYTHWGEEYKTTSRLYDRDLAHTFIDAGADLVIGSHPHVVQESEFYNGKKIYYSLGNFVFDQYFSQETKEGLVVSATFDKKNDEITFVENVVVLQASGTTNLSE